MQEHYEFLVIGAGMAGASVAAELAPHGKVLLLEAESQPGYHTTGRSAALFAPTYGPPPIRALTRASAGFYDAPPAGFAAHPLLQARGALMLARSNQLESLDALIQEMSPEGPVTRLNARQMRERVPILKADYVAAGMLDESSRDIDVHLLHQGYLSQLRQSGGKLQVNARVDQIDFANSRWTVTFGQRSASADIVINAAGAWAEQVGALAGAMPIGLTPKRRTALTVAAPPATDIDSWPAVVDIDEQFYIKPDAGRLLLSPADETPSEPTDAQPEEMDIAICIDRVQTAFDLPVNRLESKWAGLRSFVADKNPVCGFDPGLSGFFWLAGQGGYGIQTAPALARTAAALARGEKVPDDIIEQGLQLASIAPERLA